MAEKNYFRQAVANANSNMRIPAMSMVRDSPGLAATLSKLVAPPHAPNYNKEGNRQPDMPNVGRLRELSERTSQNVSDAQTVLQILPDMELAAQILVSSILSPKDMMTTELTYAAAEGMFAPDVLSALIQEARAYFEKDYKIKSQLGKIIRDALFETGSYAVAVIPENSLDEVINGNRRVTMETLADAVHSDGSPRSRGLLGPARRNTPRTARRNAGMAMESLDALTVEEEVTGRVTLEGIIGTNGVTDHPVSVTDNPDVLKFPEINHKVREQRIMTALKSTAMKKAFGRAMESYESGQRDLAQMNDRQLSSLLYREKQFAYKPITTLKTQDQLNRRTVGNPLVMHMPSEAVIPVHIPGSPDKHVGFFILLDADGHPIRKEPNQDYYSQLSSRMTSQGSFASAMLAKVSTMQSGFDPRNPRDLDYSARAYGQMVEQDLLARLRNGVYSHGVAVAKKEEVWRIMLSRALAQQHTQLLFLPSELMTYFAFKYTEEGIGKSLMDDMKILNSLRSMLTFANVMAAVKNSIGRTEVKMKFDPEDPNPQKSMEIMMHEIVRSRAANFPVGVNRPMDLVDFLQRSNFQFTHEGHPGLPDVSVDFSEKNSSYVKPDTELEDLLRKRSIMGLGLSPENVDAGFNAEFATSVLHNNLLLSKRVMQMQEVFTPQLADHLRKVMMNSEGLVDKLKTILTENFEKLKEGLTEEGKKAVADAKEGTAVQEAIIEQFLHEFITSFEVSLPQPNTVTLENQMEAFKTYSEGLDVTLDAYVSEKFFTSATGGDSAQHVEVVKAVLKAHFLRQFMAEAGIMPELGQITTLGADSKPALDLMELQKSHLEALTKSLSGLIIGLQPVIEKTDAKLEASGANAGSSTPSTDTSPTDTGGGTDDFGLGGGQPDFDVGGGDDTLAGGNDTVTGGDDTQAGGGDGDTTDADTDTDDTADADGKEKDKDKDKKEDGSAATPSA